MSEVVREFFSGAPEGCLECPGLTAAAEYLAWAIGRTSDISLSSDNPANPLNIDPSFKDESKSQPPQGGESITEFIEALAQEVSEELIAAEAIAEHLYSNCSEGARLVKRDRKITRNGQLLEFITKGWECQSQSPFARFIPVAEL